MDERDRERAEERKNDERESERQHREHTTDEHDDWRDADDPGRHRRSDKPPLTERERRERWPLG